MNIEQLPSETIGRIVIKMKEPLDVLRLCEVSTGVRSMVESGLIYAHKRGWMQSKNTGIVYDEDEADMQGKVMDTQNGVTIIKVLEYIGSWYLFKWLLVQEESDYQEYYKQHKYTIDHFLEHLMRWKPKKKDVNPRVRLALTTFRKMTTQASKANAIVVTTVDGIKKESGVPKRAQMFNRESIPVTTDEFLLQVMHMQLLRPDECKGGDERSMRVLRVYQRVALTNEQKLAGETPVKRYIIKHGGLGGHWGDDQGQMLDIATSISHNSYLNQKPEFEWLSPFIMNATEIICECMHDIDCNLDDQRISDPKAFKAEFLKKMAALVVGTSKNK
uniref:F-box domain-containing protein n=1 Tax=Clandestinovirus TaxID=2831644 RepID=A0A8F8PR29_9VIRU|nr:hypothetical protein KOM_12_416 [Clandestinovirus]